MSDFKFDTSGSVLVKRFSEVPSDYVFWSDLSPFAQGYVEAMLRGQNERIAKVLKPGLNFRLLAFSDLAPETLARIMEDCELYCKNRFSEQQPASVGRMFWAIRQNNELSQLWPLIVSLGDDGKVYLK